MDTTQLETDFKSGVSSGHPGAIFVQLTTACNARCINCPHPFTYGSRNQHKKGVMREGIWNKIIRDIKAMDYRNQVGLYLHHEPLLYPDLFNKIRQINNETNAFVVVSTNGSLLDENRREQLIAARPQLIHININSADKHQYESMTGLGFERTIRNAKDFIEAARSKINVEINCPVLPGVDIKNLENLFQGTKVNADYWANSRGGLLTDVSSKNRGNRFNIVDHCIQPVQNFNILHDGSIILCCNDWGHESKADFPNIMDKSILEICSQGLMKIITQEFRNGNYRRYRMCEKCADEMGFRTAPVKNSKHTFIKSKPPDNFKRTVPGMNILLATNHLFAFTGSEITLYTIAKFLKEKGYDVSVFAKYVDPGFTGVFNGIATLCTDLRQIQGHHYDAAYVQHHTTALEVRHHFPDLPIVLASLGVLPFLEQPPIIDLNISRYLAISEEVKANLMRKGIGEDAITIFRNIVDSRKFRPSRKISNTPRSAIIYSYRIDNSTVATIQRACEIVGIQCRRIGEKPGVLHQDDVTAQINEAEIVFTLGRGAIETMMCGKIPIIYDYLGGDGMVTPENIQELMRCNFSGRLHGVSYTVQQLIEEINKFKPESGPELRRLALEHFDAGRGVDTLAIILNKAIEDFSKSAAGIEGDRIKDVIEIITTTKNYTMEAVIRTAAHRRNKNRLSSHTGMPTGVGAGKPDRDTPHRQDITKSDRGRLRRVSIVIPVFNKIEFTRKCLDALSHNTPREMYECIIVDNASTDGTVEYLKSLGDEIRVVTNQSNLGFSKACNQGAKTATASYILFLNNDTEPQTGWLEPLVEVLDRDTTVAAAGSKLLFPDGTIQHAGVLILDDRKSPDPLVARHIYYNKPSDFREANEQRAYQVLTAACLLIRRKAFEMVGGFDEGYWNGYEDVDLCFKLQEKGWVLVYQPESVLIHHESKSGPERFTKVQENIQRLRERWIGRITPDAVIEKNGSLRWTKPRHIHSYKTPGEKAMAEHPEDRKDLVSIVILTFNELDYTRKCVESIRRNTPGPHEIIFVDNGSKDGTVKWLRRIVEENPSYKLIENEENLGFARGCNQGMEASKGEYVLLLNNDILVTENWLPGMLEHLKSSPDIGIVGPMTSNISGIQKVVGVTYKSADDLEAYAHEFRNRNRHRRVSFRRLVGFCMLFKRSLVNEIGPLDESFGTGNFEDDDFCLRAAFAGYRNVIAGDVFIHHYGSRSFIGNRINYGTSLTGNRKIFDDKWRGIQLEEGQGRRCFVLKNIEEARKQYQLGRLNKAVDLCLKAIKCVPSETKIYHELAEILIQTKDFKDALDVLHEIPPETRAEKTLLLNGFAKEGLNEDDAASTLAERTLEHPETRAEALNLKGILAYKKASLEEAASFFQQAIEVDPSYGEAHTNLGVVKWKDDPGDEAFRLLEKGFILSPDHADAANLYHSAAKNLGHPERAEAIFREAQGLYPLNRTISFLLIDLLITQEKFTEAMEEIERAMVLFEIDEGFLQAALDVRRKVGLLEPTKKTGAGTISLCMIVKDEEKNLVRCLSTIKPTVDEIIVVDTGSTDRTKEIATAFGTKVFEISWRDDFSEARNFALAKATCDWILVLDADEIIAPCDFVKMRNLTSHVRGGKARPTGFTLTTRNYSVAMNAQGWTPNDGSYANEETGPGWFPSRKVRLFKNDPRIRFKGSVHELVEDSMTRHKLKIHSSDILVHHYGILKAKDGVDKREAYYQLGKKKIGESGGNARAIYELAIQAARLRRYDEAADLWNRFFDSGFKGDLHLAYMNLGHVYLETGRYKEAAKACKKALEIDPELKEAHLNLAMSEFYMGRPSEAAAILDNLIGKIPDYIPARALLAAALILIGEIDRYKSTVDYMRKKNMDPVVFFQAYAKKLLSAGREEDSTRLLQAARNIGRDLLKSRLKSRGLEVTDEEIERVMVLAGKENHSQGRDPEDIAADLERQTREHTHRAPSPQSE